MKLSDFSLVDGEESRRDLRALVESFNRTAAPYPRKSTVHAQFAAQAARTPGAVAVYDGEARFTYAQVVDRANRVAQLLAAHRLRPEEFVGVMIEGVFDLVTTLLGVLQAGGAYLPLDADLPEMRLEFMLRDTKARFLVGERTSLRLLNRLQWSCPEVAVLLCPDSDDVHAESEGIGELMREEVWDFVGKEMFDDISGGGWKSSYTGEWLSREVMDGYGDNIRRKLAPLLTPSSRVLEIGCSSGISLLRLAPGVGFYLGTDLSSEILRRTQTEVDRRGLKHVRLVHLPAHRVAETGECGFDVVILNSVIQCFSGHNYLRAVLRQAIDLMAGDGVIFLGHLLDQARQGEFLRDLAEFQRAHAGRGLRTHVDRSQDLFVAREFLDDLRAEWPEIVDISYSKLLGDVESELTRFGYDAILRISKVRVAGPAAAGRAERRKHQFDRRAWRAGSAEPLPERSGPDRLAYAIYTSGTTGQPKGVLVEHRSILRLVHRPNYVTLGGDDCILMTGALSFDASTFEIWGALLNGASLCRPGERAVLDAGVLKAMIARHRVTGMFLTTGLFNQLAEVDVAVFAGLRWLLTGGERMSTHHINQVRAAHPALRLSNVYGPTENTTFSTHFPITRDYADDVPIGFPILNSTIYVLDAGLAPVPPGAAGEIYTGGDGLARGYLNDEAATREKFVPDPFAPGGRLYRTGDLGRWREDGAVEFLGRRDHQVKIRGFRIELGEIEVCLQQHETVKETVVLARDLGDGALTLVAYVIGTAAVDVDELRAHVARHLPEYMVPVHFMVLEAFPLTPNGKFDRRSLPAPDWTGARAGRQYAAPATEVERQLLALWEEVLGHKGIGVTDNFFASGGHSLKVTKLVALIRQRLGVELPLAAVFKAATVREQARTVLDAAQFGVEGIDSPMVPLNQEDGSAGRVFLFPPGTGDALGYVQLAERLRPRACFGFNFLDADTRLRDYAEHIIRTDPAGPHVLFGYSAGGNLAYHVALELERRGRRVAAIIMVDSAQVFRPIEFPPGEWERVADGFLGHENIRPYVATPVLQEKARRLIRCYFDWIAHTLDLHPVSADIYNLLCAGAVDQRDATGERVVSREGWAGVTRGTFTAVPGEGDHQHMLMAPHLDGNAARLAELLARIFSTRPSNP